MFVSLEARVPVYVVVGRIVAVVGLSLAIALAIFILLAGSPLWSAVALAAAVPFGAMIFLIERVPGGAEQRSKSAGQTG